MIYFDLHLTGPRCQDCSNLKCGPNGMCSFGDGEARCNCSNGYSGRNCEVSKCAGFCKGNVSIHSNKNIDKYMFLFYIMFKTVYLCRGRAD